MADIDLGQLHRFVEERLIVYGTEPGAAVNILGDVQGRYRYVPVEALWELARLTGWPYADLCALVSAFASLTSEPVGEHLVLVCDGTACHTVGSMDLVKALETELDIACGSTTDDGKFTLKTVYCVGACSLAPIVLVDNTSFGKVRLPEIAAMLRSAAEEVDEVSAMEEGSAAGAEAPTEGGRP